MARALMVGMLTLLLAGCMVTDRADVFYTRAEVEALHAVTQCRALARNLVQIARCDVRR